MIFQRVNAGDPERIYICMKSNETCAADDVVQLELNSASIDGVKFRLPDTGNLHAVIGVADAAITSGDYGLVQTYGYRTTSRVLTTDTSQDTGLPLVPAAGQVYWASYLSSLSSNSNVTLLPILAALCESITTSTGTVSRKIFIRAM